MFASMVSISRYILAITAVLYSRKLFEFAFPSHSWKSDSVFSEKLPMKHSSYPSWIMEFHHAGKNQLLRNAVFSSCLHVTCFNNFSHIISRGMANFVADMQQNVPELENK